MSKLPLIILLVCVLVVSGEENTTTTTTTTTQSPDSAFCTTKAVARRFADKADATCVGYITCSLKGTIWMGVKGKCPNGRFFNEALNTCQATKPNPCP